MGKRAAYCAVMDEREEAFRTKTLALLKLLE